MTMEKKNTPPIEEFRHGSAVSVIWEDDEANEPYFTGACSCKGVDEQCHDRRFLGRIDAMNALRSIIDTQDFLDKWRRANLKDQLTVLIDELWEFRANYTQIGHESQALLYDLIERIETVHRVI